MIYQVLPDCPLLIMANREESYARPTGPPRKMSCHDDRASWLGGIDLQALGTWLGVNEHGLVVATTNRSKADGPATPRSRGLLCRDLLESSSPEQACEEADRKLRQNEYAGCNIAIMATESAFLVEAGDELRTVPLTSGMHLITNGSVNDPRDRRIGRVQTECNELLARSEKVDEWMVPARKICSSHQNGDLPPVCLHGRDRGTVSSTLIALTTDLALSEYLYSPGPPCQFAYDDYSAELRRLLTGDTQQGEGSCEFDRPGV